MSVFIHLYAICKQVISKVIVYAVNHNKKNVLLQNERCIFFKNKRSAKKLHKSELQVQLFLKDG